MTDEELRRAEHRLLAGAATYACGGYIVRLDALHRNDLYTRLAYDPVSYTHLTLPTIA